MQEPPPERQRWRTVEIAKATLVVLCVWFGLQLLWSVSSLVFLVFLATLFGLAVARGVDVLERFGIRRGIAAALIVFGAIGAIGSTLALSAPTLLRQGKLLQSEVPDAVHKLETWVDSKRSGLVGTLITSATAPSSGSRRPSVTAPESAAGAGRDPLPTESPALRDTTARTASPDSAAPSATAPSAAIAQQITEGLGGAARYLVSVVSNTLAAGAAAVSVRCWTAYPRAASFCRTSSSSDVSSRSW
jgi:hypothetical protein